MINLILPVWANKGNLEKLRVAATSYWENVENWLKWPIQQIDPLVCSESVLDLIAWGRQITRFNNEPLSLYRKRVAYALPNAKDAGSKAGMMRIFSRLGIEGVELEERHPDKDYDVIVIRITDEELGSKPELLNQILYLYGRTCRRYEWSVSTPLENNISMNSFGADYQYSECQ